jgi:hypothetical protein
MEGIGKSGDVERHAGSLWQFFPNGMAFSLPLALAGFLGTIPNASVRLRFLLQQLIGGVLRFGCIEVCPVL